METDFLSNTIHSDEWKQIFFPSVFLFRVNFKLEETIIQIKVKPFLSFINILLPVEAVFRCSESVFFFNESFIPAGGIRMFV